MRPGTMNDREELEREAWTLCQALTGDSASALLIEHYVRGHGHPSFQRPLTSLDRSLVSVARRGVWRARVADAYAAVFDRRGLLRRKLVLLYSLAETLPPHHALFESAPVGPARAWASLISSGLGALMWLALGTVRFGPGHLMSRRGAHD